NVELARLADALRDDSRVSHGCRLAVLTFDVEARVVLPLTPAADLHAAPALAATRPGTDYASVFQLLRRQIERDLTGLRIARLRPLRPLVVLVTDGRPTRGHWPPAHAALTDPGWEGAADILAFGVGNASALTLRRLGTAGTHVPEASGRASGHEAVRRVRLVAPVMSFVLDALGHPSTSAIAPTPRSGAHEPDSWPSLDELIR
ncbi:MAG TPA: hypothetical protein VEV65_03130, partial [Kineosporiaceae bacterium]|nr:hypothetical protein [Kineosporiaceae bacterium]